MYLENIGADIQRSFSRFWKSRYRNYILVTLFFVVWVGFLSPNTIGNQIRAYRELQELKKMKAFYQKEIRENEELIRKFRSDPAFVETYGREHYLMKKDNEDIFLFVEE